MSPEHRDHGLGRRHAPDERDNRFLLRAALPRRVTARTRFWRTGPILDQGDSPMCVGFSWRNFLSATPMMTKDGPAPKEIYDAAQNVDEFDDTPPEEGTSVRAGAKVLTASGHIAGQYLWGANAADARDFVVSRGCVILGTTWYEDMFEPDAKGFVHIGGGDAGGHAYLICGYSLPRKAFRIFNSWGPSWGQSGRAWLGFDDAERLIRDEGECCSAVETKVVAA